MNAAVQLRLVPEPEWECIMSLSRDMLDGAREREWDNVRKMQAQRLELLHRYFTTSPTPAELERISPEVRELLEMDEEVMKLGRQAQQQLAAGIKVLRSGKSARRAYGR